MLLFWLLSCLLLAHASPHDLSALVTLTSTTPLLLLLLVLKADGAAIISTPYVNL
jgi:hypothetical protein